MAGERNGRPSRRVINAEMDEPELTARLAVDLDGAFETLVRAQSDRLYAIALRLTGSPADAEDLVQDALVRAYRALGGWEAARIRDVALRPWLASIVVNLARNRARARAVRPATTSLADELTHPRLAEPAGREGETPHGRLDRREAREAWAARLLALPERYRGPLVLRCVDGLSYDETADVLNRPTGTVKAQVHRGLALLRAALEAETAPPSRTQEALR
jgi:RNA polymerase sigma-70 factor, ECF subfamily